MLFDKFWGWEQHVEPWCANHIPQLRANHKMHLTKVLSQSTKSCKAKKQYVRGKIFRNWLAYILIRAVKNFCQSSCSQFGFFFGDHGPRVGGGCWLEDGLREIGTWPGGQQMEGHTSRTSGFYKKKYKSTLEMVIFLQTGHATPTIFGHYALSIFHRLR